MSKAALKIVKATSGGAPTLMDKAREIASKYADAEPGVALGKLVSYARRNPDSWDAALKHDAIVRRMLHALLCDARHVTRIPSGQEPPEPQSVSAQGRTEEERAKNAIGQRRYIERVQLWVTRYQIVGGKRITDCTRLDLYRSADERDVQIQGMARARDFESAVADKLSSDKVTVGAALTAEELNEIYHSVGKV